MLHGDQVVDQDTTTYHWNSDVIATNSCKCQRQNDNSSSTTMHRLLQQQHRNRFSGYRSRSCKQFASSALAWTRPGRHLPLLLVLLSAVIGGSMLPISSCTELESQTEPSAIDISNTSLTTFQQAFANQSLPAKPEQEENNEIFTAAEDEVVKEIKPPSTDFINANLEYEDSLLTENLEETIRNSVKNEIEIEKSDKLFTDITEPDIRKKLTEEILTIEYPQRGANSTDVVDKPMAEVNGTNEISDKVPATAESENVESVALKIDTTQTEKSAAVDTVKPIDHFQATDEQNQRDARNLNGPKENDLNDVENDNIQSIEEDKSVESKSTLLADHSPSSSSSSSSEESLDNSISKIDNNDASGNESPVETAEENENDANSIEDTHSGKSAESTNAQEHSEDLNATPNAAKTILFAPLEPTETSETEPIDAFSVVFNENLTATEPSVGLDEDQEENLIHLEQSLNEAHITETTVMPEVDKIVHVVIKKQGVTLDELPPVAIDETVHVASEPLPEQKDSTEVPSTGEHDSDKSETLDEQQANNDQVDENETTQQPELQIETSTVDNSEVQAEPNENNNNAEVVETKVDHATFNFSEQQNTNQQEETTEIPATEQPTSEPISNEEESTETANIWSTDISNAGSGDDTAEIDIMASTSPKYLHVSYDDDDDFANGDIAPAIVSGAGDDVTASTKGSRSINTQAYQIMRDAATATLSESSSAKDAGQTLNNNLADEGNTPPQRLTEAAYMSRSSIIILACSCIALLFLVTSVVFFLVSFQKQHGTLDIEMQEQRCGKDNLDDDDEDDEVNTCTKLLEIELPQSSVTIMTADETDECL